MKYKLTYWTAGDSLVEAIIDVPDMSELPAAIKKLADDEQKPLAQVKSVELVGE